MGILGFHDYANQLRAQPFIAANGVQLPTPGEPLATAGDGPLFGVTQDQMARHIAVLGSTGTGKSKFLEQLGRHLFLTFNGATVIDPHGDTVEALLAFAARLAEDEGSEFVLPRLHYLQPSYEEVFTFDPFKRPRLPDDPATRRVAERQWLRTTADNLTRVFLRGHTEAEAQVMKRLKRWLKTLFIAAGTAVDGSGLHLSLADVGVLLHTEHPRHDEVYDCLVDRLPPEQRLDFEMLHSVPRVLDRDDWLESTIHLLREFFTPVTEAIFNNRGESFDFEGLIRRREFLLVNLRKTRSLSVEQGRIVAGLIIQEIENAAEHLASESLSEDRTEHTLIVDEAPYYIAEDLKHIFERARKWKFSLCLGGQSVASFKSGELDLFPIMQSNCNWFVSFRQSDEESLEKLSKYFAKPNRVLAERIQLMDRPAGHGLVELLGKALTFNSQMSKSLGTSQQESTAVGTSEGRNEATTLSDSQAHSSGVSAGHVEQRSELHSLQFGTAVTQGLSTNESQTRGTSDSISRTRGTSESTARTHGTSRTRTRTEGTSHSTAYMEGTSESHAHTDGRSHASSFTRGRSHTVGRSESRTPMMIDGRMTMVSSDGESESDTESEAETETFGTSESDTDTYGSSRSKTETFGTSESRSYAFGISDSKSRTRGTSKSISHTHGTSESTTSGETASVSLSESKGRIEGTGRTLGDSVGSQQSDTRTEAVAQQQGRSMGSSTQRSIGSSQSSEESQSLGEALGLSVQQALVALTREYAHPTGEPRFSTAYQDAVHEAILANLDDQHALMRIKGRGLKPKTVYVRIADVLPCYLTSIGDRVGRDCLLRELRPTRPYLVRPMLPEDEQAARLDQVLEPPRLLGYTPQISQVLPPVVSEPDDAGPFSI